MLTGRVESIESFTPVDGPGLRAIVFLGGCRLRCRYCHNPEMQVPGEPNMTSSELVKRLRRFKPYFRHSSGGVTFSGGEPILQIDFLLEVCHMLKQQGIHIALDTAGVGTGDEQKYRELLGLVDLVLLDIKHTIPQGFKHLTEGDLSDAEKFMKVIIELKKPLWIRQVVVPGVTDFPEYLSSLANYLKRFETIERVDFLPYHKLGSEKYETLGRPYIYANKPEMDIAKCRQLQDDFIKIWKGDLAR